MTIRYLTELHGDGYVLDVLSTDAFPDLPIYDDPKAEAPEIVDWQRHPAIPADAPEIDEEMAAAIRADGRWRWDGTQAIREVDPEPPAPSITLSPAEFFGRMTDEEAKAIDDAMRAKPLRIRSIWAGVADQGRDLKQDTILWPALWDEIVKLYDEARADQLLAASSEGASSSGV